MKHSAKVTFALVGCWIATWCWGMGGTPARGNVGTTITMESNTAAQATLEARPRDVPAYDWHISIEGPERYVGQEILTIPWGAEPSRIPLWKVNYGGRRNSGLEGERIIRDDRLIVLPNGEFYILFSRTPDGLRVLRYSHAGKRLGRVSGIEMDFSHFYCDADFDEGGNLLLTSWGRDRNKPALLFRDHGARIERVSPKEHARLRQLRPQPITQWIRRGASCTEGGLYRVLGGQPFAIFPVKQYGGRLDNIEVMRVDKKGAIYVYGHLFKAIAIDKPKEFLLQKFAADGRLLSKVYAHGEVNADKYGDIAKRHFGVDDEGSIFQLYGNETGIHILRWDCR